MARKKTKEGKEIQSYSGIINHALLVFGKCIVLENRPTVLLREDRVF